MMKKKYMSPLTAMATTDIYGTNISEATYIRYLAHMLDESFTCESDNITIGKGIKTNQILYRGQYSDYELHPSHYNYCFCSTNFKIASSYADGVLYLYKTDICLNMIDLRNPDVFLKAGYPKSVVEYITNTKQNMPAIMLEAEECFKDQSGNVFDELSELGGFDFSKWNIADKTQFTSWISDIIARTQNHTVDPLGIVIDDIVKSNRGTNILQDSFIDDVILINDSIMSKISTGIKLNQKELSIFKAKYMPIIESGDTSKIISAARSIINQF